MPVDPNAEIEITAFRWVPDLPRAWSGTSGSAGRSRRSTGRIGVRLLDATKPRPPEYFCEQPFGQVPIYSDDEVELFESGAIVHLGEQERTASAPRTRTERCAASQWPIAALNSVEPAIFTAADDQHLLSRMSHGPPRPRRSSSSGSTGLKCVSDWLGDKEWLEDRFTIGDLMMVAVLRQLRGTGIARQASKPRRAT